MSYILAFLILLSVLVIFHEFGHFATAKLLGVGVEVFSVGFGRPLIRWRMRETEYRIALIPFGGFVKCVGETSEGPLPEAAIPYSFSHRSPWQRALIVFAGPFMNLVLAFLIFAGVFLVGYPEDLTVIGMVEQDSPAFKAGIIPGDKIISINGKELWRWNEMSEVISQSASKPLAFKVERDSQIFELPITPKLAETTDIFGRKVQRGVIGIGKTGRQEIIGIADNDGIAFKAGLRTGDNIVALNSVKIRYREDFERALKKIKGPIKVAVIRYDQKSGADVGQEHHLTFDLTAPNNEKGWTAGELGIEDGELYISGVLDDSPAKKAGLLASDRLYEIDGQKIESWEFFSKYVRSKPDIPVKLTVLREGNPINLILTPEKQKYTDPLGNIQFIGRIGVYPEIMFTEPAFMVERYYNPLKIIARSFELTWFWTKVTVKAFYLLIIGEMSAKSIGGPIMIAKMAGDTAKMGFFPYIMLMAILSLNLAIVNLVPMPVLDGGQIFLFVTEMIRRKPYSQNFLEGAQKAGFAMLGLLIVLILYNDISRFWYDITGFFTKLIRKG